MKAEEVKNDSYLNAGALKKQLENIPDDTEVFIRCCNNPTGNIVEAGIADDTEYGSFGTGIRCIIIEPSYKPYAKI